MIRRVLLWLGTLAGLWIASYGVLSLAGGYLPDGNLLAWQPKWCALRHEVSPDGLRVVIVTEGVGAIYAPLILLDRRWLHPDEPVDVALPKKRQPWEDHHSCSPCRLDPPGQGPKRL